jgi:hypothetical protein
MPRSFIVPNRGPLHRKIRLNGNTRKLLYDSRDAVITAGDVAIKRVFEEGAQD